MKSRTLISLAVASTLGWSAAAFAGSSHEVVTPLSVNETGPVIVSQHRGFGHEPSSSFATASAEHTIMGSTLSDSSDWTGSAEQVALAEESSDYYIIAFEPVAVEGWDFYIIDVDADQLALSSDDSLSGEWVAFSDESMSGEELALSSDEFMSDDQLAASDMTGEEMMAQIGESDYVPSGALQEDMVAYVLSVDPVEDTANVG
jgi:hypothetical protein